MKLPTHFFDKPSEVFESLSLCSPKVSQLFVRGNNLEILSRKFNGLRVGIVGTRDATQAGKNDARRIAQAVCTHGGVVVSGMALGIDGAAHQGAIDVNGLTITVLGSGLNQIYPARHKQLFNDITKNGVAISEFDPETKPLAWHFPIRNRIIASLSDVLVVPEGTLKGGARITVDISLAMGQTLCTHPGSIRNRSSELPNSIIKDGAVAILDPADVLRELGMEVENVGWRLSTKQPQNDLLCLNKHEETVVQNLAQQSMQKSEIQQIVGCTTLEISNTLKRLELTEKIRFRRGLYEIC